MSLVRVDGATLYAVTRGHGPALLLMGGGPSNADTLGPLAAQLAPDFTVTTYDRRGYSRSQEDAAPDAGDGDPDRIARHAADARQLIATLGEPVAVFGTSFGALVALELAATAPAAVGPVVVHEPPLGQLLEGAERQPFDVQLDAAPDARAAFDAIAASVGARRDGGHGQPPGAPGPAGPSPADVEVFIHRDAPAIGAYHLDFARLRPLAGRLTVAGSASSHGFYPYRCAQRLAGQLGTPLAELPGDHAGMIRHPADFAAQLRALLRGSAAGNPTAGPDTREVT